MKFSLIPLVSALLAFSPIASGQTPQTPQELPSAPSSVVFPKQTPPPAPKPPAEQAKPQPPAAQPAPAEQKAAPKNAEQKAAPAAASVKPEEASAEEPKQDIPTIVKRVDRVNLVFTVTDKRGRFVKDLKKDDFKVLDDNKPPVSIESFRSETDLPLRVGLLVDASNSIRDRFKFEQESAIEFLNQVIRPKSDRAFVIGFDTTAEVTADFTDDTGQLSRGVRMLRAGGGTALYDALYFACRDKLMKAEQGGGAVRRAIILLSDGEDNQSRVTREEAIEMAQRAEVIVYTISTNITGIKSRGDKVLERIAEQTGGRAFAPFKIQDVANAFTDIQEELRSQYAMTYKPADFRPDGRFRSITIAADHKGMQVRARKGYYAPRQ